MILDGSQPQSIQQAVQTLRAGELLGLPTETVYGLAANALDDAAVRQIFLRKGRPADHPLIVHVANAQQALHFASAIPCFARQLMDAFWPGPLTLILPRRADLATAAAGGHGSIGLRCPSHPMAQQVLNACLDLAEPIFGLAAPSANRFGKISPTLAAHVQSEFGDPLLVLDGGACDVGIESTIVDCTRNVPVILRPGMVGADEIATATGLAVQDPFGIHADAQDQEEALRQGDQPAAPGTLAAHYAPNAKVRLMDAQSIQAGLHILGEKARNMAIYARTALQSPSPHLVFRTMPADPARAAHELFGALREMDDQGIKLIWVESVPDDPAWNGVRDRLERAAASL